jgi:uncharacterized membrane protein YdbT with pleckstrin-like domain
VRQRAVGHERYNSQQHKHAPTKSEVRRQADASAAAPRLRTVVATAVVAALFFASCIYWIVIGLMPPAAAQ